MSCLQKSRFVQMTARMPACTATDTASMMSEKAHGGLIAQATCMYILDSLVARLAELPEGWGTAVRRFLQEVFMHIHDGPGPDAQRPCPAPIAQLR